MVEELLYIASYTGHLDNVKYLVENGANIESSNDNRWTRNPLVIAKYKNHSDIVKYLEKKKG
jgi:ankyrin repeat protein